MNEQEFELTYRIQDFLELYRDSFRFKLLSRGNYSGIAFVIFFLVMAVVCIVGVKFSSAYYIGVVLFLTGSGHQIIEFLKLYWEANKKRKEITNWLEDLKKYKSHHITLNDKMLKYVRDGELFLYDLDKVKAAFHRSDYFYVDIENGGNIVLPAKSFEPGEYLKFTNAIDEIIGRI